MAAASDEPQQPQQPQLGQLRDETTASPAEAAAGGGGERQMPPTISAPTIADSAAEKYGLDEVLLELGSSGRFQIRIFALLLVPVVLFSMYEMTYLFTTGRLDYRYL